MSKTTLCILLAAVLVPVAVIEARPHARPVRARVAQSEVSIDRDIQLRSTAERTVAWVDANKAAMRRAAGIEVLQDFGNGKVKVRKINTSKGNFVWIAQETLEVKDGVYTFKSTLVESIEGGVISSDSEIKITSVEGGVNINVKISAAVNNPRVTSRQMRMDMNIHFNRVKRLLEENVR